MLKILVVEVCNGTPQPLDVLIILRYVFITVYLQTVPDIYDNRYKYYLQRPEELKK